MSDSASGLALVPLSSDIPGVLRRAGVPENIARVVDHYAALADLMRRRRLSYLSLPAALSPLAESPVYQMALPWGRGFYYDQLHDVGESGQLVRVPVVYGRSEILEQMKADLALDDPRVVVAVPLAWRVGVVVGWLSGLAVSQKDDVQAAMVVLAVLVAPFLSGKSSSVKRVKQADVTKLSAR